MNSKEKRLSVRWRFEAGQGALLWQLMFTETNDLIGQKRFVHSRTALLFCIDIETGEVVRDDYLLMDHVHPVPAGEGWFVGLETTLGNLVYCYTYQAQSPEHKGIWAVDFRADRVVWSRSDVAYAANLDHEFLAYQLSAFGGFPERHFLLIDPFTGEDIQKLGIDGSVVNTIRQNGVPEEERQQVILPEFVSDDMTEQRLALRQAGIFEASRCECIVQGSLTVVGLHSQGEFSGVWSSVLQVWSKDALVYDDFMEEGVEKPCLNNFLIRRENLYYLKNKEELVCVALR